MSLGKRGRGRAAVQGLNLSRPCPAPCSPAAWPQMVHFILQDTERGTQPCQQLNSTDSDDGSCLPCTLRGFRVALVGKNPPANAGDAADEGSIPGSGKSPGGGNGKPLQYSRLENPMDRGVWWAPRGRKESGTTEGAEHKVLSPVTSPDRHGNLIRWDQLSSVAQSCPTPCDPMDCSTPGLPVHHQLPQFTQTHVH